MFNIENFPNIVLYNWGKCINHVLQLVIKDEILSKTQVKNVCDLVRVLTSKANHSVNFSTALRTAQQVSIKFIIKSILIVFGYWLLYFN